MSNILTDLSDLDRQLVSFLEKDEIMAEEIVAVVDKREQLLQSVLQEFEKSPELINKEEWKDAVVRTQKMVLLMQANTNKIAEHLKKYRHGNKSVQQYKKFL
ncbi:flagellar protein FliT [Vibrio sp. S9_S30]|uniref:flagellar protein FliT n=1 Tax=Vibrio sp. S9_S30 TaxID=2720226 RepID=UPI0016803906|nr:flagellar protein FliT [Vibrio sp. S9_S30]MBD1556037.1 flagellar protein FliT [Vibrio sp. S9_S30]